jgi:hypothetical protein
MVVALSIIMIYHNDIARRKRHLAGVDYFITCQAVIA